MITRAESRWKWCGLLLLLVVVLASAFTVLPTLNPEIACQTGNAVWAHKYDKYKHCTKCKTKCRRNWFTGHVTCKTVCRTIHCGKK